MPTNPWWLWLVYPHTQTKSSHIFSLLGFTPFKALNHSQHPVSYRTLDARAH